MFNVILADNFRYQSAWQYQSETRKIKEKMLNFPIKHGNIEETLINEVESNSKK
jgi:hypothetical protein